TDKVQGAHINGAAPDFDAIADGRYPISRPLYFYVKKAHVDVIPGIREYLKEFTSDSAWGEFGDLTDKGLIPLAEDERREVTAAVQSLANLNLAAARWCRVGPTRVGARANRVATSTLLIAV